MTTLELYRKHKKGEIGRDRFLYEVRRDNNLPWVTNTTSYDDAVKILKNKGIIREELTAEDIFPKAAEYYKKLVPKGTSKEHAKKAIFTALNAFGITPIDYNIQNFYDSYIKDYLKDNNVIKESVQTDPIVDSVNPYALKRAVHKLLDKEKVLTNDSYVEALNKAAKKLTTPQAVKQEMFANADAVAKADAKLQTQEVKKANHKDKHNDMKKVKGQQTPKATSAPTKENKKTKKPKGVEVMKDRGVEGSEKVLKETVLAELQSYLKKKLKLSENIDPNYHVGMEVHLPDGGMGKIVQMIGSTCTVEREDGVHQDLQLSALNYAKKKAMEANEHPAMAEEKVSYEKGIKLADKLVDAIEMFNSLSDEEKEAEAKRLGVDVLAKLKAAHDYIMNRIHDEDNYPAQEEDLNLKELNEQDIQEASSVDSIITALEEAQEQLRDGVSSLKLARKQMFSSGDPKLSRIGERIYRYMLGHIEPLIDSKHQWLTNNESIQNIIDNLRGNEGEEDDELDEAGIQLTPQGGEPMYTSVSNLSNKERELRAAGITRYTKKTVG